MARFAFLKYANFCRLSFNGIMLKTKQKTNIFSVGTSVWLFEAVTSYDRSTFFFLWVGSTHDHTLKSIFLFSLPSHFPFDIRFQIMMMNFVFNLVVIFILGSLDESHVLGSGTAPTDDGVSVWLPVNDLLGNIAGFGKRKP